MPRSHSEIGREAIVRKRLKNMPILSGILSAEIVPLGRISLVGQKAMRSFKSRWWTDFFSGLVSPHISQAI
jgi:hypothetical protein